MIDEIKNHYCETIYCHRLCRKIPEPDKINVCNKERKQKKNRMQGKVPRKAFTNDRVT